jgi:hypothetical protein
MLKAIDSSGRDHVSVDISNQNRATYYRLARDGELMCPECLQQLWFKAGEQKIYHFAHKDLGACSLEKQSERLIHARAILYLLVRSRFAGCVRTEVKVEGVPRCLDVLVEWAPERKFGYWIIEGRFNQRLEAWRTLERDNISVNWVFLADVMRRNGKTQDFLNLTPTERDLKSHSRFSQAYWPAPGGSPFSLHYLDVDASTIITFRAIYPTAHSQVHTGHEVHSPVADILIADENGEIFHPGELQLLGETRTRWALKNKKELEQRQEELRLQKEAERRWLEEREAARAAKKDHPTSKEPVAFASPYDQPVLKCVLCGRSTADWAVKLPYGAGCKCKSCLYSDER